MTCPGATRYCLPPVAITASMPTTFLSRVCLVIAARGTTLHPSPGIAASAYLTTGSRRKSSWTGLYVPSGGPHVVAQPLAEEQPRAVHARLHGRQADVQRFGDLRVGEPLDVVQEERGPVVPGQIVDGGGQQLAQLGLERRLLGAPRPVAERLRVLAELVEAGRQGDPGNLVALDTPAAELLLGR